MRLDPRGSTLGAIVCAGICGFVATLTFVAVLALCQSTASAQDEGAAPSLSSGSPAIDPSHILPPTATGMVGGHTVSARIEQSDSGGRSLVVSAEGLSAGSLALRCRVVLRRYVHADVQPFMRVLPIPTTTDLVVRQIALSVGPGRPAEVTEPLREDLFAYESGVNERVHFRLEIEPIDAG